jgi:hypothetical protein
MLVMTEDVQLVVLREETLARIADRIAAARAEAVEEALDRTATKRDEHGWD